MTLDVFLLLLFANSILTSLTVESIKTYKDKKYNAPSNILVGIVAIILGTLIGVFYIILENIPFNVEVTITIISLVFLSWLSSMVGYDKVVQAITQIKLRNKNK